MDDTKTKHIIANPWLLISVFWSILKTFSLSHAM